MGPQQQTRCRCRFAGTAAAGGRYRSVAAAAARAVPRCQRTLVVEPRSSGRSNDAAAVRAWAQAAAIDRHLPAAPGARFTKHLTVNGKLFTGKIHAQYRNIVGDSVRKLAYNREISARFKSLSQVDLTINLR